MNKRKLTWILLLVFGLIMMACQSTPKTKLVTLIAEDIHWEPALIEAEIGQEIQLTIRNDGALDHSFVSDDFEINLLLSPGEVETLSFVVSEAGTFSFICSIPGHEEAGMSGQIIVAE